MNDEGTVFKPNEAATREEAAYAIAMAYKITNGSASFNDTDAISDWALDKIDALAANGYINGRPDGNFAPKETLTRADVITMIDKITAELINKAGTYDQSIKGNLVVRIGDVTLKDMNVSGNLYIAEGVGEGDITLENVQVNGKVFVEGGGAHSLKVLGTSKIGEMIVGKANDKPVRIYVEKGSAIHRLDIASGCILEGKGNFEQVNLKTSSLLQINGVEVKSLAINTTGFITMDKETTIGYLECNSKLDLSGSGKIKEAIIKASDCKIDVKPEKVDFATKDITATIAGNKTSSSGTNTNTTNQSSNSSGNSSSGGGSTVNKDKKLVDNAIKLVPYHFEYEEGNLAEATLRVEVEKAIHDASIKIEVLKSNDTYTVTLEKNGKKATKTDFTATMIPLPNQDQEQIDLTAAKENIEKQSYTVTVEDLNDQAAICAAIKAKINTGVEDVKVDEVRRSTKASEYVVVLKKNTKTIEVIISATVTQVSIKDVDQEAVDNVKAQLEGKAYAVSVDEPTKGDEVINAIKGEIASTLNTTVTGVEASNITAGAKANTYRVTLCKNTKTAEAVICVTVSQKEDADLTAAKENIRKQSYEVTVDNTKDQGEILETLRSKITTGLENVAVDEVKAGTKVGEYIVVLKKNTRTLEVTISVTVNRNADLEAIERVKDQLDGKTYTVFVKEPTDDNEVKNAIRGEIASVINTTVTGVEASNITAGAESEKYIVTLCKNSRTTDAIISVHVKEKEDADLATAKENIAKQSYEVKVENIQDQNEICAAIRSKIVTGVENVVVAEIKEGIKESEYVVVLKKDTKTTEMTISVSVGYDTEKIQNALNEAAVVVNIEDGYSVWLEAPNNTDEDIINNIRGQVEEKLTGTGIGVAIKDINEAYSACTVVLSKGEQTKEVSIKITVGDDGGLEF